MKKPYCRVCGHKLFLEPLLHYADMPKSAQELPDKNKLKTDVGAALDVCQCSGCGLVQLSTKPVSYYKNVIRAAAFSPAMQSFRRKQFTAFIKKYSLKNKKVIEIGCGRGEYLSLIKKCGAKAYGLENLKTSADFCAKSGLKVSAGFIGREDQVIAGRPFDAFLIMNYFEHLPNPNLILAGIKHNLVEEGIGLIEVPNFDMILRNKLFAEFIPDHLCYFKRETLYTALNLNGFDILECRAIWHDYIISAVVKKRKKINLSVFHEAQDRIQREIVQYLRRFKGKKVAIWGAGHQALAIMALLNLAGKIEYVIDSAPFKQGKFTPVTHLPIVSPASLDANLPAAIIVMAGGYSDEVARILKRKYGRKIEVSIIRENRLEIK